MVTIEKVDTTSKAQVRRFVDIPFRLYADCPQWVPPIRADVETMLNPNKHPFYEHSDAEFFIAVRGGRDVGRIAALENKSYNKYHDARQCQFYLFECVDDQEVANALFERLFQWARARGLTEVVGPKGFSLFDGYGIQVEGTEHRQMMMMMNYNYPYYPRLVESLGFEKEVDFVSTYIHIPDFNVPERVHRIAERVKKRRNLTVHHFKSKADLRRWKGRIGAAYNQTFVDNWEYYPVTQNEINFILDDLILVANPRLIKIVVHEDDVVGFVLGFPDVSRGLQRANGRLLPFGIFHLLLDMQRTDWISLNGAGIVPEYQGLGGNALLYSELTRTVKGEFGFVHAELTQVAESAVQMRRDLVNLGAKPYKNHRVYIRAL
jgi:GNAT superfamily N-acetyltransferase